jgi:hypothetical protein
MLRFAKPTEDCGTVVAHWEPLYLHPAPTPAASLSEILAKKGNALRTEFEPKPRSHIGYANKIVGERAELIARIKEELTEFDYNNRLEKLLVKVIPMLEYDACEIDALKSSADFYKRRVELLQTWQSKMRDPERTIACDIIASGQTLPPENAGDRYKVPVDAQQVAAHAWTPTADRMPEPCTNVLAYTGKGQPIRAQWVPAKTLVDNGNGDFGVYDEATDECYWPEAWYETNAHEETHWIVDGLVTHWIPLPRPPQGDKPLPDSPPCNPHPSAPHGFSRNASHSAGRYVCDCEGWVPDET